MIKPSHLNKGDKVAIVSLSWGGLGDAGLVHKYYIAKERLEKDFGLEVITMPNALKGSTYIYENPEARGKDLMDAFKDKSIKGIFCAIGGDDTVRLLPYIDYDIIKNNPKVFMGYSDTTVNHFMMYKAGLASYYGPSVMAEFGEYVKMADYTKEAVENILFSDCKGYEIKSSPVYSMDHVPWSDESINTARKMIPEEHGYELLQGQGSVTGKVLGGCLDVFPMIVGTEIWPAVSEWKDKILLLETSEEKPSPDLVTYYLRNLGAQGIFDAVKGILVGKPQDEMYYEEYKKVFIKVMKEFHREDLPILYNINIGHAFPTGIMPLGLDMQIDFTEKRIIIAE